VKRNTFGNDKFGLCRSCGLSHWSPTAHDFGALDCELSGLLPPGTAHAMDHGLTSEERDDLQAEILIARRGRFGFPPLLKTDAS
jgi:hypothetical protein